MSVRSLLPLLVWSTSIELKERNRRTQSTIRSDRIRHNAASTIVRRKCSAASVIECNMTGSSALRRLFADLGQLRAGSVKRIRRHGSALLPLILIQLVGNQQCL